MLQATRKTFQYRLDMMPSESWCTYWSLVDKTFSDFNVVLGFGACSLVGSENIIFRAEEGENVFIRIFCIYLRKQSARIPKIISILSSQPLYFKGLNILRYEHVIKYLGK